MAVMEGGIRDRGPKLCRKNYTDEEIKLKKAFNLEITFYSMWYASKGGRTHANAFEFGFPREGAYSPG